MARDDAGFPDAVFILPERLVIFDHLARRAKAVVLAHVNDPQDAKRSYVKACESLDEDHGSAKKSLFHRAMRDK